MAATYEPIATQTLTFAATVVTFSSIPSTYTDLLLIVNGKNDSLGNRALYYQLNNNTGSNYSWTELYGNGSSAGSNRTSNSTYGSIANFTSDPAVVIAQWQNYANTSTYKTVISRASNPSTVVQAFVSLWRQTSAISEIDLYLNADNFNTGTTFTLYGILAA